MRVLAHEVMLDEPGRAEAAGFGDGELFEGVPEYLVLVSPGEIRHSQFVEQIEVHATRIPQVHFPCPAVHLYK